MADTYAQAGDDRGLEQFYLEKIALFRSAPLPADARKAQIATLRRGLIPALTRMNNYSGAVDQYIELINNFPEDDTLVTEAALVRLALPAAAATCRFLRQDRGPVSARLSLVHGAGAHADESGELPGRHRYLCQVHCDSSRSHRPLHSPRRTRRALDALRRSCRRLRTHLSTGLQRSAVDGESRRRSRTPGEDERSCRGVAGRADRRPPGKCGQLFRGGAPSRRLGHA